MCDENFKGGVWVVRKISFSSSQLTMVKFVKKRIAKKRFCDHIFVWFNQHCGRPLLLCKKCRTIQEMYE